MSHQYPYFSAVSFDEFHNDLFQEFIARKKLCMEKAFLKAPKASLVSIYDEACKVFCVKQIYGASTFDLIKDLSFANQTGISFYRYIRNEGKKYRFTIEDKTFETVGQFTENSFYFDRWLRHLCVAIILRDNAAIQFLCKIKKETFKSVRLANMPIDDALMDFIQSLFDANADHRTLIMIMMDSTGPENYSHIRARYATNILMPMANLFMMVLTNVDEEKYQEVWRNAVKSHQDYWSSDSDLVEDYQGWVSFPILAASVMMFDKKGYKLPSDLNDAEKLYVPKWLVYGEFDPQPSVSVDFYEGEI